MASIHMMPKRPIYSARYYSGNLTGSGENDFPSLVAWVTSFVGEDYVFTEPDSDTSRDDGGFFMATSDPAMGPVNENTPRFRVRAGDYLVSAGFSRVFTYEELRWYYDII